MPKSVDEISRCNNEPCCTQHSKIFLSLSTLITFILPLLSITQIAIDEFNDKMLSEYANCCLIVTYIIVLLTFGYMITRSHKLKVVLPTIATYDELKALDTSESLVSKGYLAIYTFISILGLGDSLFNLTSAGNQLLYLITDTNNQYNTSSILIVIENFIKFYYHLCLLLFIFNHDHYLNVLKCVVNKAFIFTLSISCFLQWVLAIIQELRYQQLLEKHVHNSLNITMIGNGTVASFTQIQRFLLPFSVEYRITLFIEFYCIYLYKNENECLNVPLVIKLVQNIKFFITKTTNYIYNLTDVCLSTVNKVFLIKVSDNKLETNHRSLVEQIISIVLILLSIQIVSFSIVIVLLQDYNQYSNSEFVSVIREISNTVLYVVVTLYSIFIIIILYKRRYRKQDYYSKKESAVEINMEKQIDFIFLVISNLSVVLLNLLSITGLLWSFSVDSVSERLEVLQKIEIFDLICSCVQAVLQLFIIWVLEHDIRLDNEYTQILTLLNFAIWIFESFSIVNRDIYEIQKLFYSKTGWEIITLVLLPVAVFYRFHSFIMLIKIVTQKYKIEHEH